MMQNQGPTLRALAEINDKQDKLLQNQERTDAEIKKIHTDCRRMSATTGAAVGVISGGIMTTGIVLARTELRLQRWRTRRRPATSCGHSTAAASKTLR